jgi:predicted RNase H-like HicB family nuclease
MKIEVTVEKTKTGYSAYAKKYAVYTAGNSLEELKGNILEAISLYFEDKDVHIDQNDLKITLDLPQLYSL